MNNKDIPIVIPSYEPDNNFINLCKELYENNLKNIIIIDDGSGKEYEWIFDKIKEDYDVIVLKHAVNLGKGRALKSAFNYILNLKCGSIIGCVTADSDGQHTVSDIKKCIDTLRENNNSLVLGCRVFDGENVPFKSRFGNELTKKVFSFLCGISVSDTQTGLRGIGTSFMKKCMQIKGERFEYEMNMLINSGECSNIIEVPIKTIYDSKDNHKTHFDPVKDSIRIYRTFGKIFKNYLFSSLSSCVLDLILFTIFCGLLKLSFPIYYVAVATVIARVISAIYNYIINYKLVFKSKKNHNKTSINYIILAVVQMILSASLVTIGMILFKTNSEVFVKIIVDTVLFFVSYYIQKKFVF